MFAVVVWLPYKSTAKQILIITLIILIIVAAPKTASLLQKDKLGCVHAWIAEWAPEVLWFTHNCNVFVLEMFGIQIMAQKHSKVFVKLYIWLW